MTSVPSLQGVRMLQCKENKQQKKDKEVRSDMERAMGGEGRRISKNHNALQTEK